MIFTFIVVGLFVFFAPAFVWLSIPICFAYFFLKSAIKIEAVQSKTDCPETEYDEFDWWQDNRGL